MHESRWKRRKKHFVNRQSKEGPPLYNVINDFVFSFQNINQQILSLASCFFNKQDKALKKKKHRDNGKTKIVKFA
jgi:hypothetical protein